MVVVVLPAFNGILLFYPLLFGTSQGQSGTRSEVGTRIVLLVVSHPYLIGDIDSDSTATAVNHQRQFSGNHSSAETPKKSRSSDFPIHVHEHLSDVVPGGLPRITYELGNEAG